MTAQDDISARGRRAHKDAQAKPCKRVCVPQGSPPVGGSPVRAHKLHPLFMLLFDVAGTPSAEPRPRAAQGRRGVYVPSTAHDWKHEVRAQLKLALLHDPLPVGVMLLTGPLRVDIVFRMPRPKSHWRTGRHSGKLKDSAPDFHTSTPDKDNLEKALVDALGAFDSCPCLLWVDDAQIADGRISKRYVRVGEEPGASVAIWELT